MDWIIGLGAISESLFFLYFTVALNLVQEDA